MTTENKDVRERSVKRARSGRHQSLESIAEESAIPDHPGAVKFSDAAELLGGSVILIPLANRSKVPPKGYCWKDLAPDVMCDCEHLARLQRAHNIGVILGKRSGGLCTVDLDT